MPLRLAVLLEDAGHDVFFGACWRCTECAAGMLAQLSERYDLRSAQLVGASSSALVATLSACGAGLQLACSDFYQK